MKIGKRPARILLYEQVVEDLCLLIDRGDFEPGDQLPSERELIEKECIKRGISCIRKPWCYRITSGKGTFFERKPNFRERETV